MIITEPDLLFIPFGAAGFHARHFALAGFSPDGLALSTPVPHALVSRSLRRPIRINNGPVQFILERAREDLSGVDAQFALLRANLVRVCGDWQAPARDFLNRYFADVEAEIEAARATLEDWARPFAGLFEPRHWMFSALMPLPRAHIHLPRRPGGFEVEDDDLVRVDFAFWTGERLVAVVIDTGATLLPRQRRVRERLEAADLDLVTLGKSEIAADGSLLARLGERFRDFWQDEPLPSGPFKGATRLTTIARAGG